MGSSVASADAPEQAAAPSSDADLTPTDDATPIEAEVRVNAVSGNTPRAHPTSKTSLAPDMPVSPVATICSHNGPSHLYRPRAHLRADAVGLAWRRADPLSTGAPQRRRCEEAVEAATEEAVEATTDEDAVEAATKKPSKMPSRQRRKKPSKMPSRQSPKTPSRTAVEEQHEAAGEYPFEDDAIDDGLDLWDEPPEEAVGEVPPPAPFSSTRTHRRPPQRASIRRPRRSRPSTKPTAPINIAGPFGPGSKIRRSRPSSTTIPCVRGRRGVQRS